MMAETGTKSLSTPILHTGVRASLQKKLPIWKEQILDVLTDRSQMPAAPSDRKKNG